MKAVTVSLLSHCQHKARPIYRGMGRRELSYRKWGGGSCPTGKGEEGGLSYRGKGGEGTALYSLFND